MILRRTGLALLLAASAQGCTSYFKILSARVDSTAEPNVILEVDVDLDLQSEELEKYITKRFSYIVLDEERLKRLRRLHPELPATIEEAGPVLISDTRHHFSVFSLWDVPEPRRNELITDSGGIESGTKVAERRWRHRVAIPFRAIQFESPADPSQANYARSDAYELKPDREYWIWGQVWACKMFTHQYISSTSALKFRVPQP